MDGTTTQPDYMITYDRDWKDIVEKDGVLDLDQVARELSDYGVVMEQASKVYDELSGGRVSKPNTAAHHVIDFAGGKFAADYADMLCDRAQTCEEEGQAETAQILRELAEEWHEGSVTAYQEGRDRAAAARDTTTPK